MSIARVLRLLLLASAIALALLAGVGAEETPRQRLDAARVTLEDIDAALKADNLTDADLARLRAESDSLALQLQAVIAELSPRLDASAKRLAELTPKTKESTAANDATSDELTTEKAKHDTLDADLRSARAMLLQSDEDAARIGTRATRTVHARNLRAILEPGQPAALDGPRPRGAGRSRGDRRRLRGLAARAFPADEPRPGARVRPLHAGAGRARGAAPMGRAPGDRARSLDGCAEPSQAGGRRRPGRFWCWRACRSPCSAPFPTRSTYSTSPTPACKAASTLCWMDCG